MVETVNGDIFASKSNFIVHQVNCQNVFEIGIGKKIAELYPHVEVEYRKYLRYCKKGSANPLGTVQYVPVDNWALPMIDTMKNEKIIDYDTDYQYIVNLFGQTDYGFDNRQYTNLKAFKNALYDIKKKAYNIEASVAIPYKIGCDGKIKWEEIEEIIQKVFSKSDVEVGIWRR